ncbi:MAG: hypothetical protein F4X56_03785 [Gammaproteobacteria bacterium]|nr:hypothetical protein [Gammaproteobacteria bacterium]MYC25023.1 hypothetical protein [Gammaproteobacteria bacterium]
MQVRTKSIVHQVIRPVWNAWMRFGHHQLSLTTSLDDGAKVGHETECPCPQTIGQGSQDCSPIHGEQGI